jgi:hypothetical protein
MTRSLATSYAAFGSALEAAGAACLADAGEEAVREELRAAARAGLAVFELAGTIESSVTDLESGDEERFVDTSAANQWTYVRALYAALADRDAFERALEAVAEAEREYYGKGSPEAALLLPARGLRAVAERV